MKLGWYWTAGTSAFQRYHPSNLFQPSSPCCLLPPQVMELFSEPEWLLLELLGWKARPIGLCGQAIEFWVCAQHIVCVGRLMWSRMGYFLASAAGGRLDGQDGEERGQEWDDGGLLGTKNW